MDPANYSIRPADEAGDRENVESPPLPKEYPAPRGTNEPMPDPCDRDAYLRWYYDRPGGYSGD